MRNGVDAAHHAASAHPDASDPPPLLHVEGLSKGFGQRPVVDRVSFSLSEREFVAVLGPSGAGKTTLFRCITGMANADTGRVRFGGIAIEALTSQDRCRIAMVFQQFNLVRRLTALENVLAGRLGQVPMWRGVLRRFESADTLRGFECLERVGMLDHAHQRADTLSGGQQQRVAIARALAQEPRLIVADEPVASLDPSSAAGVLELLRKIARSEGVAVICSLHQVGYARGYADRIIGLSRGRITIDAPTHALHDMNYDALYGAADLPQGATTSGEESRPETLNEGDRRAALGLAPPRA